MIKNRLFEYGEYSEEDEEELNFSSEHDDYSYRHSHIHTMNVHEKSTPKQDEKMRITDESD